MLSNPIIPIRSNVCRLVAVIHPRRVCTVKLRPDGVGNLHPLVMHIRVVEVGEHIDDRPNVDECIAECLAVCVDIRTLDGINGLVYLPQLQRWSVRIAFWPVLLQMQLTRALCALIPRSRKTKGSQFSSHPWTCMMRSMGLLLFVVLPSVRGGFFSTFDRRLRMKSHRI